MTLPFTLENTLERRMAADPEWIAGVEWALLDPDIRRGP
jgi:hypothetical protein